MNTRRIGIAVFLTLAFVGLSLSSWAAEPATKGDAEGFGQGAVGKTHNGQHRPAFGAQIRAGRYTRSEKKDCRDYKKPS